MCAGEILLICTVTLSSGSTLVSQPAALQHIAREGKVSLGYVRRNLLHALAAGGGNANINLISIDT